MNIRVLPPNSLCQEIDLPGKCTGVVVDGGQIVILDVSGCPSLYKKYWDISKIPEILKQMEKSKNVKKKSATTWGKKGADGDENGGAGGVGSGEKIVGDLGGWLNDDPTGPSSSSVPSANGLLHEGDFQPSISLSFSIPSFLSSFLHSFFFSFVLSFFLKSF